MTADVPRFKSVISPELLWGAWLLRGGLPLVLLVGFLYPKFIAPGFAAVGVGLIGLAAFHHRRFPAPDPVLAGLFTALGLWACLSGTWAINPDESLDRVLRLVPSLAAVALLLSPDVRSFVGRFRAGPHGPLALAVAAIWVLFASELIDGFQIYRLSRGFELEWWFNRANYNNSVHNRLITYTIAFAWVIAAYARMSGRPRLAGLCVVIPTALVLAGFSNTAVLAIVTSITVWGLACLSPRLARILFLAGVTIFALGGPFLYRPILDSGIDKHPLMPYSGAHRLEIFDYTSEMIFARPLLGWGIEASRYLPASAEQLGQYWIFDKAPIHAHNTFLQVWLELGLPGLLLWLVIVATAVLRTARLPRPTSACALAALAAMVSAAAVSFSLWSSSYIAAMAITGFCFLAFPASPGPYPASGSPPNSRS